MSRVRKPRVAEIVAGRLRERIVEGRLPDGDELPPLDRLVEEFEVSPPSIREALRILESEGLITVRRGSVGGAEVHAPTADGAAFMFGLVLQSRSVPVADVAEAFSRLLIMCAAMCAEREDRDTAVIPRLQAVHDEAVAAVDGDARYFVRCSRRFHRELVALCGNESLELSFGMLESLWSVQDVAWARRVEEKLESPDPDLRRLGLADHQAILEAVRAGRSDLVSDLVGRHCSNPRTYGLPRHLSPSVRATDWTPGLVDVPGPSDV